MKEFSYLGSTDDGEVDCYVKTRTAKAARAFGCLKKSIFTNPNLAISDSEARCLQGSSVGYYAVWSTGLLRPISPASRMPFRHHWSLCKMYHGSDPLSAVNRTYH